MTTVLRALLLAAACAAACPAFGQAAPGAVTMTLVSGGVERSYRLHVPAGYDGDRVPLVVSFHGSGGSPEQHAEETGLDALADSERFAVAYPAGVFADSASARSWNSNAEDGVDDVAFTRDVIAHVGTMLVVDRSRIYVTGFAAGARLASRVACELADVLAAAAVVAGLQYPDGCMPAARISLVAFHGKADAVHRYSGTDDAAPEWRMSFETAVDRWIAALGCPQGAMEGGFAREPGLVVRFYPPCADGAELVLYVSERDGHVWPSGASERIASFFKSRRR